ncbi:toll/interleukin-1 receptor domain-containing protein [uncultured Ruminococcus sp.]|uniref:toll/interleukin-1 receptor domain-containing protein n=1 Tax=uncultured Ruminococcus sp. TaxID=165186 RepID=UPI002584AC05|nr:toll/interleukin-1 receptor domain-containing protein [uncultured Ruminococcus sp.]
MSVEQYQRTVNRLEKEIADLEKKKADKDKNIAILQSKIISLKRSINKHTSPNSLANKNRQIASYESDKAKKSKESADLEKKIAEKKRRLSEANLKLQKEQQNEQKKQEKITQQLKLSYENRIDDLQQQLVQSVIAPQQSNSDLAYEEYDVFISHAWEDKEDFVDELVVELRKQELKVWYDTNKLRWGDSMREKIDKGLAKSRYGIVVLSPNYIAEHKYWTKAELNGLFQMENINDRFTI